jgi:hypothetical protein
LTKEKKLNKTAMMKTLEVFIAALITFTFVIVILPPKYDFKSDLSNSLLKNIEEDDEFRNCVISENSTCIREKVRTSLYGYYNYTYQIFDDPSDEPFIILPERKINTFSIVIAGNFTEYDPKIFKMYYWINKD